MVLLVSSESFIMAVPVTVPRLGWNMDEGVFVEWLKQDGDPVQAGDELFTLEGEKSVQSIETFDGGILRIDPSGPAAGDVVAVGATIAYLLEEGESIPSEAQRQSEKVASKQTDRSSQEQRPDQISLQEPPASPSVRRQARVLKVDLKQVKGSGPGGRILESDLVVPSAVQTSNNQLTEEKEQPSLVPSRKRRPGQPSISPRAARRARDLGIDWTRLTGSGRSGRIRESDIVRASDSTTIPVGADSVAVTGERVPLSRIRNTIARRMIVSQQQTAPVTLTTTVDATNLVNLRKQFKTISQAETPIVPSYLDLVVKLAGITLPEYRFLNARWEEDGILLCDQVHIGIATETQSGLLVPVIRNVSDLALSDISQCSQDLVHRAQIQQLAEHELSGSTFTITNLGAFGVEGFTPIINFPECAVLGLGRIDSRPVVMEGQVVVRETLYLSLTFDHRIIDGAPAARFLQSLGQRIENPSPWLVG